MFKALFSARGRMRRRDWWLWRIGLALAYLISLGLMHRFFGTTTFKGDLDFKGWPSTPFHDWLIFLLTIGQWPLVCVDAKRWHDRTRPGWLAGIGLAISLPQTLSSHVSGDLTGFLPKFAEGAALAVCGFASLAFGIWMLVDCGILDGTQGPNPYGPSPKGVGAQPEDIF